ncbi:hypothetical protein [Staphylococcus haemolyticus]|uniref:hypothetical protein n=1 Tax=Staphylococcus haemolyticus TaxID=1283 RepID=UPI001F0AE3EB|nr:hypothetical protein [Staphylococcus haemolyticus]MCH4535932.1 hypothetical protein [Staphylococcus haemolyticus]
MDTESWIMGISIVVFVLSVSVRTLFKNFLNSNKILKNTVEAIIGLSLVVSLIYLLL